MSKPVVLITGASQGIGAAIARVFSQQIKGVKLALVARNQSRLNAVSRGCSEHGAAVETYCCDVSDSNEVDLLKEAVLKKYKHIDVLINNAGVFKAASFLDMEVEMFDDLIDTNLRSVFLVSKAFVPSMVERKRGDIFNMSSIAGLIAYSGGSGYSAAKFGVTGLSKVMRAELKTYGIKVCCVCPGATVSPSWRGSNIRQQRLMPAEDVARAFYDIYCLSKRTVVEEIVLRPILGDL